MHYDDDDVWLQRCIDYSSFKLIKDWMIKKRGKKKYDVKTGRATNPSQIAAYQVNIDSLN